MENTYDLNPGLASISRRALQDAARCTSREVIDLARRLVAIPSGYPPGDTNAVASEIVRFLSATSDIEVLTFQTQPHVSNVVARVTGSRPGRRIVFNGHMDTFPLGNRSEWTASPEGEERDGKLYGLGVADMKGGIAAQMFALRQLAQCRTTFAGEVVATFVGDEESMGQLGTQYLLEHVPHARGDAMISGDTGSPRVLRFGEKGMIWIKLTATGRSSHVAHTHLGEDAIEHLMDVIDELKALRRYKVSAPPEVMQAIDRSTAISESMSGTGESEVLKSVTVTCSTIQGGRLRNLVSDHAECTVDIRLPAGTTLAEIERELGYVMARHPNVSLEISRHSEPSWTEPGHEVIRILRANIRDTLSFDPAVNMRVGASDARLYRYAGIPSVVCGLTAYNMGAADEHVYVEELTALGEIFTLSAFDFLVASPA